MIDAPVLQVALDMMHLKRAMEIAREAVEGGADWVEAGTPLIKSEGMDSVRQLKRTFPDRIIVADMKVMDTGAYEVEMAAKAGADVVHVLGAADDETIHDAVRAGHKYGGKVCVDLIGIEDRIERARQLQDMGMHFYATEGTERFMAANGLEAELLHWPLTKKQPNVLDYLAQGRIDMVINIPKNYQEEELTNDYIIRRRAVDFAVPLITNVQLARRFVEAISRKALKDLHIKSWKDHL